MSQNAVSTRLSNTSRDGGCTPCVGGPFQGPTAPRVLVPRGSGSRPRRCRGLAALSTERDRRCRRPCSPVPAARRQSAAAPLRRRGRHRGRPVRGNSRGKRGGAAPEAPQRHLLAVPRHRPPALTALRGTGDSGRSRPGSGGPRRREGPFPTPESCHILPTAAPCSVTGTGGPFRRCQRGAAAGGRLSVPHGANH